MHVLHGAPEEKIAAEVVESTAAQLCYLTLVKNAAANVYGWEVKSEKCQGK